MQKPGISIFILVIILLSACQSDRSTDGIDAAVTMSKDTLLSDINSTGDTVISNDEDKSVNTHPGYQPPSYRPRKLMSKDKYKLRSGTFEGFLLGNWTFDIKIDAGMDGIDESDKGRVLQLHGDYTYDIWDESTKVETGIFTWDRNNTQLRLTPTLGEPSEWTIQYVNNSAIFIGTATYGNNAIQMRLKEGLIEF
jgi:hypothetical protein